MVDGKQTSFNSDYIRHEECHVRPAVRDAIDAVYRVQVFDPLQVINADTFDVYPETVVVHILSAAPLASRVGKINVAKE